MALQPDLRIYLYKYDIIEKMDKNMKPKFYDASMHEEHTVQTFPEKEINRDYSSAQTQYGKITHIFKPKYQKPIFDLETNSFAST